MRGLIFLIKKLVILTNFIIFKYKSTNITINFSISIVLLIPFFILATKIELFYFISCLVIAFLSCSLHDIFRLLLAQRLGIILREMSLTPLGSLVIFEEYPNHPSDEIKFAVGSSLLNGAIAGLLLLWAEQYGLSFKDGINIFIEAEYTGEKAPLLFSFIYNFSIFVFQSLPVLPLNGGRILRAFSALFSDYDLATNTINFMGNVILFLLFIILIFVESSINELIISSIILIIFINTKNKKESRKIFVPKAVQGLKVGDMCNSALFSVDPSIIVASIINFNEEQEYYPVAQGDDVLGVVSVDDLRQALKQRKAHLPVSRIMTTHLVHIDADTCLADVYRILDHANTHYAVVKKDGVNIGMISTNEIEVIARRVDKKQGSLSVDY